MGHEGGGCQLIVLMVATAGHGPGEQRGESHAPVTLPQDAVAAVQPQANTRSNSIAEKFIRGRPAGRTFLKEAIGILSMRV